jgi:hypothetical protein
MPSSKVALASGLVAIVLCGCSSAGSQPQGRGKVESQFTYPNNHLKCLRNEHFKVTRLGPFGVQIGDAPSGPQIWLEPTPGIAQGQQIQGRPSAQGAEVISAAQVYPNGASDGEMKKIETCMSQGVGG